MGLVKYQFFFIGMCWNLVCSPSTTLIGCIAAIEKRERENEIQRTRLKALLYLYSYHRI